MTGKHRKPNAEQPTPDRPDQRQLTIALVLAGVIATTGLIVTMSTPTAPVTEPVVVTPTPPPAIVTTAPAVKTTPARPRTTNEVWEDCQRKAAGSEYPATTATQCMIDDRLNQLMACLAQQCPTTEGKKP